MGRNTRGYGRGFAAGRTGVAPPIWHGNLVSPTTAAVSKSSPAKPAPPAAEKETKATPAPPPPSQPEETKTAEIKEKKEIPEKPSPDSLNAAKSEKVVPAPVTMAAAPPPKEPVITLKKEKTPAEYLGPIKAKLNEQGFSGINTWLDEKGRLVISGQVKNSAQKDEITSLVKSVGFPGKVDFEQLTVIKRVVERPVKKRVVRETREIRETPAPSPPPVVTPMKPLGPKLD
jgi:hypothetical protein